MSRNLPGSNVVIESSFVWDNVIIEDGVVICNSLICNEAKVLKNAVLQIGCIISFRVFPFFCRFCNYLLINAKVVVGSGIVLPSCSKVTTCTPSDDDDGELVAIAIGNGSGMLWVETDEQNQLGTYHNLLIYLKMKYFCSHSCGAFSTAAISRRT